MKPIEIELNFRTGFTIGTGLGIVGVLDNTIMRDAKVLPCIPGTTIKGILRDACEEVALIVGQRPFEKVSDELAFLIANGKNSTNIEHYSWLTRIFGSPLIPSCFEFSSAYLHPFDNAETNLLSLTTAWSEGHNKIFLATGTAEEGHLYFHETAMPTETGQDNQAYRFSSRIVPICASVDDSVLSLLFCGIRFADRLGAKKSRGKGVITLNPKMPYPDNSGVDRELEWWLNLTLGEVSQ